MEIIIRIENGSQPKKNTVALPAAEEQENDPGKGDSGISGAEKYLQKLVAPVSLYHFATKLAQNEISTVELRTGSREYEQKLQFGLQVVNTAVGLGASIYAGAQIGGPVGAIVTAGLWAVNKAIDISQRYRVLDLKQTREDITLGFARVRAGGMLGNTGGRE